jgi:hypothetical protein
MSGQRPSSHSDDFDPYHKWLGIPKGRRPPTYYDLLAISLDEEDHEVIRGAAEQRRYFVETKRGTGHDEAVAGLLYQINEAEVMLLNPEMRRDYDRQLNLFHKRRKKRQVDPYASPSRIESRPGRTVGEGSGIVSTFIGVMAVLMIGIGLMAWFSFQLPWTKPPIAEAMPELLSPQPAVHPELEQQPSPTPTVRSGLSPVESPEKERQDTDVFLVSLPRTGLRDENQWWSDSGEILLGGLNKGEPLTRKPLIFEGQHSKHGIYLHAGNGFPATVSYGLTQRFSTFRAIVLIPEMLQWQGDPKSPVVFKVIGDGRTLWQSTPLVKRGEHQVCEVPVDSIKSLTLTVECLGANNWGLAGWIEPRLSLPIDSAAAPIAKPRVASTGGDVWLDAIAEQSFVVGHGTLGKNGSHGYGPTPVSISGKHLSHALSLHPPKSGSSYVIYALAGRYKEFRSTVGISDAAKNPCESKLAFSVVGDGKVLWRSSPIQQKGIITDCRIDITGVQSLKLEVNCPEGNAWAFAVWAEPILTPIEKSLLSASPDSAIPVQSPDHMVGMRQIDDNRRVAEWVLQVGGKLQLITANDLTVDLQNGLVLPKVEFSVVRIDLKDVNQIRNDDLSRLTPLRQLSALSVMGTQISDDGLRHLARITSLQELNVAGTQSNGSGFRHLSGLDRLSTLLCGGCVQITDGSLIHLKSLPQLTVLGLIDTGITDAGLQTVGQILTLKELKLSGIGFQMNISDKGLRYLSGLKQLEKLSVRKTKVTKQGIASFQKAVPACTIVSDFSQ